MSKPRTPTLAMDTGPINEVEIAFVLSRCKSSSCPGPVDQIPYIVLKKCPSLLPALRHIFNWCWIQKRVPAARKVGVLRLLGKKKAEEDPREPKNFRPIALTSCIGKVLTIILKHRIRDWEQLYRKPFLMAYQVVLNTMSSCFPF